MEKIISVSKAKDNVRPNVLPYPDTGGSGGLTVVVREVDDTETNVTGLTPSVLYTFSVTAENDVSSQDNNINSGLSLPLPPLRKEVCLGHKCIQVCL